MDKFINIKKILVERKMDKAERTRLAKAVFPDVKFPVRAFSRIVKGEAEMTVSQAATVAEFLGVRIEDLYEPDRWLWGSPKDGKNVFLYGDSFRAEVDTQTWVTRLYHKDELVTGGVLCDGQTPVSEYFSKLRDTVMDWLDLI